MKRRGLALLTTVLALLTVVGIRPAQAATTLQLTTIGYPDASRPATSCADATEVSSPTRVTQFKAAATTVHVSVTDASFSDVWFLLDRTTLTCVDVETSQFGDVQEQVTQGDVYDVAVGGATATDAGTYTLGLDSGATQVASTPDPVSVSLDDLESSGGTVTVQTTVTPGAANTSDGTTFTVGLLDSTTPAGTTQTGAGPDFTLSVSGSDTDDLLLQVTPQNAVGKGATVTYETPVAPVASWAPGADGTSGVVTFNAGDLRPGDEAYVTAESGISDVSGVESISVAAASPTTLRGLQPGTSYRVEIAFANQVFSRHAETTLVTMSRPSAPSVSAGTPTSDAVSVTLGAAAVAAGSTAPTLYSVTATAPGLPLTTVVATGPGAVTIPHLLPATAYSISATATNTVGVGLASAAVAETTLPAAVVTPPPPPAVQPQTVKLTLPTKKVKARSKATFTGSVTEAGKAVKGVKVALTQKVKGRTTTVATKTTDAKGGVSFSVKPVKGATYQLVVTAASKSGSVRFA